MIDAIYIKCGHITDNALQRPVNLEFRRKKVRKHPPRITGLLIAVVFGLALDSGDPAALVGVWVGKDKAGVKADLGIQPSVAMRGEFQMIVPEQLYVVRETFYPRRRISKAFLPIVKAAAPDAHSLAQKLHRKLSGKLQDHLVFLLV